MKVFAFIVTYNRLESLKKVYDCVMSQTHPIEKVFIINNGSTDNTKEWLKSLSNVEVINQDNIGGAGGFCKGVQKCFEEGADWIWMMDDDVYPEIECLNNLMRYSNVSDCLNTTRYWANGEYVPQLFNYDINTNKSTELKSNLNLDYQIYNTCCFEGLLISKKLVEEIGFPDKKFFIAGDDVIYGYLASLKTNVILVRDAVAHKLQPGLSANPRPFYLYYTTRNHFIVNKYKKSITGSGFSTIVWVKYYFDTLKIVFKQILYGRFNVSAAVLKGCLDGLRGKTGNSY